MEHVSAGWYGDPRERHYGRYFDGRQWTANVCDAAHQTSVDPLGVRPNATMPRDAVSVEVRVAQKLAAYDQELIERAHARRTEARLSQPLPRQRSGVPWARLAAPAALALLLAGWWTLSAGPERSVISQVDQPESLEVGVAPSRLAFSEHSDGTAPCVVGPSVVEVRAEVLVPRGFYRVELCGSVLRFTAVGDDSAAVHYVGLTDAPLVQPDGAYVTEHALLDLPPQMTVAMDP